MTFSAFEHRFVNQLAECYSSEEASMLFFLSVSYRKGWKKAEYLLEKSSSLPSEDEAFFEAVLGQLKQSKPIQYILGETEFYGLPFSVNPSVLIPRPETEELVQWMIQSQKKPSPSILDIGTGSGCIAIALKTNIPQALVLGLDISTDALGLAKQNAKKNNADVRFLQADILQMGPEDLPQKFEVLVSNPPYIPVEEKGLMKANVLHNEPHIALFVTTEEPLVFYEKIAALASQVLVPEGYLYFEINERFATETSTLLSEKGFCNIELRTDLNGKDRMIRAQRCV